MERLNMKNIRSKQKNLIWILQTKAFKNLNFDGFKPSTKERLFDLINDCANYERAKAKKQIERESPSIALDMFLKESS